MAARVYFVPDIVLLFVAFILSLLVTISLPYLPTLDIVRCRFTYAHDALLLDTRFGVWGTCIYEEYPKAVRVCRDLGTGYSSMFTSKSDDLVVIEPGLTSGLVAHPVATLVIFIAFLSSLSFNVTLALFASLLSFIAGLVTLTAFAFDIALVINVRDKARQARQGLPDPQVHDVVAPGPGFWITLVSLILLFMATYTAWLGRHRSRMVDATDNLPPDSEKSSFFARFRRS